MCGRNKAKERKVLQPNLDWSSAAINAKIKREGYVTFQIGNGHTGAMVH